MLPSIVDLLGIETQWRFDGHSLFDGSEPKFRRRVTSDVEAAFEVAARQAALFPRGDGWDDLAAVGTAEDLVGRAASEFRLGAPSDMTVTLDRRDLLADLSVDSGLVPYTLRRCVAGQRDHAAGAGRGPQWHVRGHDRGYRPDGDAWKFSGLMANYFVDGPNEVVAYQVERTGNGVVLHEVDEVGPGLG